MTGTARETATPTKGESLPGRECRLGGTRRDPLSGPYRGKRPIPDGEGASLRTQWGVAQKLVTQKGDIVRVPDQPHLRQYTVPELSPSTTILGHCEKRKRNLSLRPSPRVWHEREKKENAARRTGNAIPPDRTGSELPVTGTRVVCLMITLSFLPKPIRVGT